MPRTVRYRACGLNAEAHDILVASDADGEDHAGAAGKDADDRVVALIPVLGSLERGGDNGPDYSPDRGHLLSALS